jgi:hypothetical protein
MFTEATLYNIKWMDMSRAWHAHCLLSVEAPPGHLVTSLVDRILSAFSDLLGWWGISP